LSFNQDFVRLVSSISFLLVSSISLGWKNGAM